MMNDKHRVRIGILAHTGLVGATPDGEALLHFVAAAPYVKAVQKTGALPLILPVSHLTDLDDLLDSVDGLVITGGDDLDPASYGSDRHPQVGATNAARDAIDLAAARAVVQRNLPTLAVCRGIQVMNVALGGTLIQHVDDHMRVDAYNQLIHTVSIERESVFAPIIGDGVVGVNSLHHQVLDQLGAGVKVEARNIDGHVEAISVDGAPNVLAVQWHPELLRHDPTHLALFRHLTTQARVSRRD